MSGERPARALGVFSLGLGLAELGATRWFLRTIGVRGDERNRAIAQAAGVRELVSGVGIFSSGSRPAGWVWARVAGDAMDFALLVAALNQRGARRNRVAAAMAAGVGATVLDAYCAAQLSRGGASAEDTGADGTRKDAAMDVKQAITVNKGAEELYAYWHDFEKLPTFMTHLKSVTVSGDGRSHWKAKAPAGTSVEWDAEVVEDRPNELIAWRSLPGADVENAGSVRFVPAPGDRGTEVHVEMRYDPPAGRLGAAVAKLFGEEPNEQTRHDLRAFKQVMETGEVVRSEGAMLPKHPAQPSADGDGS